MPRAGETKPLPTEAWLAAAAAYRAGVPIQKIAETLGVGMPIVRRALVEAGIEVRRRGGKGGKGGGSKPKPPLPPTRAAEIVAAYESGETVATIAEAQVLTPHRVTTTLKAAGVTLRRRGARKGKGAKELPPIPYPERRLEKIKEAHRGGATVAEIAKEYGVAKRVIRDLLQREGLLSGIVGKPRRVFTEQELAEIVKAGREGEDAASLAKRMGTSFPFMAEIFDQAGIPRVRRGRIPPFTEADKAFIVEQYREGVSAPQIARLLLRGGAQGAQGVYRVLRKAGVQMRKKGTRGRRSKTKKPSRNPQNDLRRIMRL